MIFISIVASILTESGILISSYSKLINPYENVLQNIQQNNSIEYSIEYAIGNSIESNRIFYRIKQNIQQNYYIQNILLEIGTCSIEYSIESNRIIFNRIFQSNRILFYGIQQNIPWNILQKISNRTFHSARYPTKMNIPWSNDSPLNSKKILCNILIRIRIYINLQECYKILSKIFIRIYCSNVKQRHRYMYLKKNFNYIHDSQN